MSDLPYRAAIVPRRNAKGPAIWPGLYATTTEKPGTYASPSAYSEGEVPKVLRNSSEK